MQRGHVERRARDRLGIGRIELDDDELERILAFAESEPTAAQLTTALDALPADQRAALNARVLEEQDYNAIARSSGTAEATIRKRVSRALRPPPSRSDPRHTLLFSALDVAPTEVVNAADGWPVAEAAVGPPAVVANER
jgi:hypothetical protein